MSKVRFVLLIAVFFGVVVSAPAQDESKLLFNIGGGIGFPQGDLGSFVNNGANVVVGAGYGFNKVFGVDAEFMWHDLPIQLDVQGLASDIRRKRPPVLSDV
jgi:hypothetical protein